MAYDAIILSGGRSSRLGGTAKSTLVIGGRTLLDLTIAAASGSRRVVVVGDTAPEGVARVREDPPFGGPAAGIAAAVAVLAEDPPEFVLVLACDMPRVRDLVPVLVGALGPDGVLAVDDGGREQYLAAIYPFVALAAALSLHGDGIHGLAVRRLVGGLSPARIDTGDLTDDIDTWDDFDRMGA